MSCPSTRRLMKMMSKRRERLNSEISVLNLERKKARRRITTCLQVEVTRAKRRVKKKRRKALTVMKTPIIL
ncbi:hypothetical protein ANCCAN_29415 [Ancylostoma caninum]|uniref:Uncharacterized protein n=1 Tax=Ancylostoma caninum TaxID=29170 RepID=A0A368F1G9_ANCCA|nr:hypothetical protein ANCCAN_29415 [Ancylostoma caninum]